MRRWRMWGLIAVAAGTAGCSVTVRDPGPDRPRPRGPRLEIDRRYLPGPGQCRLWIRDRPAGRQARVASCGTVTRAAPPGSWVLYRPLDERGTVRVRHIDPQRGGVIVAVRVYDVETRAYLRDLPLVDDPTDDEGPRAVDPGRRTPRRVGRRGASGGSVPRLTVARRYFPAAGRCRLWYPDRPARDQPAAGDCARVRRRAPAGAWVLWRRRDEPAVIRVEHIDARRAGVVVRTRVYDVDTGAFVREEGGARRRGG